MGSTTIRVVEEVRRIGRPNPGRTGPDGADQSGLVEPHGAGADIDTEALLFQTGYLTIMRGEELGGEPLDRLGYPNREVR